MCKITAKYIYDIYIMTKLLVELYIMVLLSPKNIRCYEEVQAGFVVMPA